MSARHLELELEGLSEQEVLSAFDMLGFSKATYSVSARSHNSGQLIIDIYKEISQHDQEALAVFLGYLIGRAVKIEVVVNKKLLKTVKDVWEFLQSLRS